jgi:AcrR family transcriptional regulator
MNKKIKSIAPSRGRPRDQGLRAAALAATRALLNSGGLGAVTMDAVSQAAAVSKPTLYRWWPDKNAMAMSALMDSEQVDTHLGRRTGIKALQFQLQEIAATFSNPAGRHLASMLAAADGESELSKAFRNHFILARWEEGKALLAEAQANKELSHKIDIESTLDALYGALFFRLLLRRASIDRAWVKALCAAVLSN